MCKKRSVMSIRQYKAYCDILNLHIEIKPVTSKQVREIGGISKAVGVARVQTPFNGMNIVIDVKFLIIQDPIPTLLILKAILDKHLEIYIQDRYISHKNHRHTLRLMNYFL